MLDMEKVYVLIVGILGGYKYEDTDVLCVGKDLKMVQKRMKEEIMSFIEMQYDGDDWKDFLEEPTDDMMRWTNGDDECETYFEIIETEFLA